MIETIRVPLDVKWPNPAITHVTDGQGRAWILFALPAPSTAKAGEVVRAYAEKMSGPDQYELDINLRKVSE